MSLVKAIEFLQRYEVLLASGSPRRLEIFAQMLGVTDLTQLSIPESVENMDYRNFGSPVDYVLANVQNKLAYAIGHLNERRPATRNEASPDKKTDLARRPAIVVAADTVVVDENTILEKPKSVAENARMVRQLSGRIHHVITAVSFSLDAHALLPPVSTKAGSKSPTDTTHTFSVQSQVTFAKLDDATIQWYAESKEGLDKAGGYGIQGLGAALIESFSGCFYTIVGFPVNRFLLELSQKLEEVSG
ncbi:hypothetical protein RvY_13933 [Ramazzottius varieornatus]|uniref:Maf-like protein n=1 Tax=Ramazzottius varieornatus TaxID=947166 RepID=A0A1D1VRQ0_RAMVA|nr:hypothetical protein RvY_13933 [Ramazzottius varieornatus]